MKRATITELTSIKFDVLVIGGGINGCAIARDAAIRGLTVALVEADDLASGTSAWSSRMIHGGLRYLEHGEVGLVRESLQERELLLRNAPHLVTPLPTILPIYRGARRGPLMIRAGMLAYDVLSCRKSMPSHQMLTAAEAVADLPAIESGGLRAAARYYDAQITFAERLVVENAESAWRYGARIASRVRSLAIEHDGAVVTGARVRDELTGLEHSVQARQVVNVAGPWVDEVLTGCPGYDSNIPLIGGTKGSHLVVDRWNDAPVEAIYHESALDHRPVLIIPWNGMILLGSTDDRFTGDPADAIVSDDDVSYLLSETNAIFPAAKLTPASIRYGYAGIRPLPSTSDGSTGAITRQHIIRNHRPRMHGLWSIIGGKLTTHRSLAEEAVDQVGRALGTDAPCRTRSMPLPGALDESLGRDSGVLAGLAATGLERSQISRLMDTYGARSIDVVADQTRDGRAVLDPESGITAAEVRFAIEEEMALTITDVLMRRSMVGLNGDLAAGSVEPVASAMAPVMGWDRQEILRQIDAHHAWVGRLAMPVAVPAGTGPGK